MGSNIKGWTANLAHEIFFSHMLVMEWFNKLWPVLDEYMVLFIASIIGFMKILHK